MKKTIYKQIIKVNNLFLLISVLDLKTKINYLNIFYNTKYKILFLSKNILSFPSFFSLYLFSNKLNILNIYIKNIESKILEFYIEYKLRIEFIGTGYKFFIKNKFLYFILGYSHLVKIKLPSSCNIYLDNNGKLLTLIHYNKYILGNIFYIIKYCKKLNIYKGKGIKNIYDQLKLKLGKTKSIKK